MDETGRASNRKKKIRIVGVWGVRGGGLRTSSINLQTNLKVSVTAVRERSAYPTPTRPLHVM